MNKNKLSRFLLSTSVGMIATLGISEVLALAPSEKAIELEAEANQSLKIAEHRSNAVAHYKEKNPSLTDAEVVGLVDKLMSGSSGVVALNRVGGQTAQLFEHFKDMLLGGVELTEAHFDSFLAKITDVSTLSSLGVGSIRDLKSPEAERLAVPSQVTKLDDAVYFAEQRKDAGEFEAAAAFFLKARDLTESTNTTKRIEFAEKALLMYSEHFIHHVARVTIVTEANIAAAQTLLASVKALAESTNTVVAFKRAASCAEELGAAIYDLVVLEKAARDKLTDATLITAANTKISGLYIKLYSSDIIARNMHEIVAGKLSGQDKNSAFVLAADAMRLAIGALADERTALNSAVFAGDVTVATKLAEEAAAFKDMYTELAQTSGVTAAQGLTTSAASAKILISKLKATWNARSRFVDGTAPYSALNNQYATINSTISDELTVANDRYTALASGEHYLSARDIVTVRSVEAERLYRVVLDAAAVDPIVEADVTTAITALHTYVTTAGGSSVVDVVTDMDTALKNTLDEVKAAAICCVRTESNRTLAGSYALIAKARALQLEKNTSATSDERITWLESYLSYARLANHKASWAAGVAAADELLKVAAIANATTAGADLAGDKLRLIKGLVLAAKAEALLRQNTAAADDLVAKVNADNVLASGLLFDAEAVVSAINDARVTQRISGRDHLRKAFEMAVELHSSNAVRQGLRAVWASVESAFAVDKTAVADVAIAAAIDTNSSLQQQNGQTWAVIVAEFTEANADAEALKDAIRTAIMGADGHAAGLIAATAADSWADRSAILAANTLAKYFDTKDVAIGRGTDTPADHAWYTVDGLYNDLKAEYDRILALSTNPYVGYTEAAKAFEKARMAKTGWAAAEVAALSSATYATWETKRDAAGAAYTAAADYEVNRLRTLFAAAGYGEYGDAAFDTLDKMADALAVVPTLAATYVGENILKSVYRRASSLKDSAATYNTTRAAIGTTEAAIAVNDAALDAAIEVNGQAEANNTGAFALAHRFVKAAYAGLAGFNADADFGTFVGERLTALTTAYRNVVMPWLSDVAMALALTTTAESQAHRDVLQAIMQDGAAVNAGTDLAGRIFSVGALVGGIPYAGKHSSYRDIALSYDVVLRTLVTLSTTATTLEDHQGYVSVALKANANAAKAVALTAYTTATTATTDQMNEVIAQLKERADIATAAVAGAYGALRTNSPSNTNKTYKAARAQAITEMTGLIQEGAMDLADVVLKEETSVATADLKAKAAHELGRLLMEKAKAERVRFDNLGVAGDKDLARQWYEAAIDVFDKEIKAILSQTDASLMANRNTRLMAAYELLAEAYKQAIMNGAMAAWSKDQHLATFNYAQILYRTGEFDRSAAILEALVMTSDAEVVHRTVLRELAEQYEAAGKFLKSAKAYKASALQHVAKKDAAGAFEAAENALKAARQTNQTEACDAAAAAFNAVGATLGFHGRVRAEAYHKAAEAYILGDLLEEASVAYYASGMEWAKIGDHMQAGNQHEQAAWALSKVESISVDQRIEVIQAIEKAAHQLQIAEATTRIEKLVDLAEAQITSIRAVEDSISAGKLKAAVIAGAGAMYEKALAFKKKAT